MTPKAVNTKGPALPTVNAVWFEFDPNADGLNSERARQDGWDCVAKLWTGRRRRLSQQNATADHLAQYERELAAARAKHDSLFDDDTPAKWLKARFRKMKPGMPPKLQATPDTLRFAALSSGYGLFPSLVLAHSPHSPARLWDDTAFAAMWWKRADYVLSLIDFAGMEPHGFWEWLESSDKVGGSFALGSAFCKLTADAWLEAAGRKLTGFFHFGLYNQALASGRSGFYKPPHEPLLFDGVGKRPDFIATDNKKAMHLFEAKGGARNNRPEQLKNGLVQLRAAPQSARFFHGLKQSCVSIGSSVAVFAAFDHGKPVEVHAYDPPGDPAEVWHFIPAVAHGMAILEAKALFDALPVAEIQGGHWCWKALGSNYIGVSNDVDFKEWQRQIGRYVRLRAALPSGRVTASDLMALEGERPAWTRNVLQVLRVAEDVDQESIDLATRVLQQIREPKDLLVGFADALNIEILLRHTHTAWSLGLKPRATAFGKIALRRTSAGLAISSFDPVLADPQLPKVPKRKI